MDSFWEDVILEWNEVIFYKGVILTILEKYISWGEDMKIGIFRKSLIDGIMIQVFLYNYLFFHFDILL